MGVHMENMGFLLQILLGENQQNNVPYVLCTEIILIYVFPQRETDVVQYLYRHHGNLLVVCFSLGIRYCCSLCAYWLTRSFLSWLSILGCFPLCRQTKQKKLISVLCLDLEV